MGRAVRFSTSLDAAAVGKLVEQYKRDGIGWPRELKALAAGQRIRKERDYSLENLLHIVRWKAERSKGRVASNLKQEVEEALRVVALSKSDRVRSAVLVGLRGVQVPMASAILTAFDPKRFTVIDFRALESLGTKQPSPTIEYYLRYLDFCRAKANEIGVSLRDFDQALWQASKIK